MADNNVLFATSLALIASLVACVDINFSILTATIISHFKTRFNPIRFNQIVESFCLRQRRLKRLQFILNLVKNDYGFAQREQVPGGTANRQAGLLCSIYMATATFKIPRNHIAGTVCVCVLASTSR